MSESVITAGLQIPAGAQAPLQFDFDLHALRITMVEPAGVRQLDAETWDRPGVYALIGTVERGTPTQVRVGQSTQLRKRLAQHVRSEPISWWRAVAVVRDKQVGFNSAEIGYLEGRLGSELRGRPGVSLFEGQRDTDTTLPAFARAPLDAFVRTILEALKVAGVSLASPADEGSAEEEEGSGTTRKRIAGTIADLLAAGHLAAGSRLEASRGDRTTGDERRATAEVLANGELLVGGVSYRSPSTAAQEGLGVQAANGWTTWRLEGRDSTLADLRNRLRA